MRQQSVCNILSFDYSDFDVYLNVRAFYSLCGYAKIRRSYSSDSSLVVVLRGSPPHLFPDYHGILHVYDYVREFSIDYRTFFPNASSIIYVSIHPTDTLSISDQFLYGYLPVLPQLWLANALPCANSHTPVHIGNYKPIVNDSFQEQLISLIKNRIVTVYGGKWDRRNIKATPVSYLMANSILSRSPLCFGLMYPYQRGSSLSGRMWQAPLHGCPVISEPGTNCFDCPGVIEVADFLTISLRSHLPIDRSALSHAASAFWLKKTELLAKDLNLNLVLNRKSIRKQILVSRCLLFSQHIVFLWSTYVAPFFGRFKSRLASKLRYIKSCFFSGV
ncbi:MAG: hypothetical protein ACK41W_02770 [Cyanobacteriota bacterium]|jgi:hypothetical protein